MSDAQLFWVLVTAVICCSKLASGMRHFGKGDDE